MTLGSSLQPQQALAAKQHIAVEEGLGQRLVGIMRRADPLVQILGKEVQLEVVIDLAAAAAASAESPASITAAAAAPAAAAAS